MLSLEDKVLNDGQHKLLVCKFKAINQNNKITPLPHKRIAFNMHDTVFCDRKYMQRFGVKHWHKFHPLRLKVVQVHSISCIRPEKKHQSINYPIECIM